MGPSRFVQNDLLKLNNSIIIIVPLLSFSDETRTMPAHFLLVFFTCYGYKEK